MKKIFTQANPAAYKVTWLHNGMEVILQFFKQPFLRNENIHSRTLKRAGNSLVDILTMKIVSGIEANVWSRFRSWNSVEILIQKFGQDLEAEV